MRIFNSHITAILAVSLLSCALLRTGVHAGTSVEIRGNSYMSVEQINGMIGHVQELNAVRKALYKVQREYFSQGFLFAKLFLETGENGAQAILTVDEGTQARFGNIAIKGSTHFRKKEIGKILGIAAGEPFDQYKLVAGVNRLMRAHDEAGFPFVQVWVDTAGFDIAAGKVNLTFYIMDGGQKNLTKIKFEGLLRTREQVVLGLSGLETGGAYSASRIEAAVKKLRASNAFADVQAVEVILSPDGRSVESVIKVKELVQPSSFNAALGYADREGNNPKVLSGIAELKLVNMGGSLKDLHLKWSNDGAGRTDMTLSYIDRFFRGRDISVGAILRQTGLDTIYTWQSLGVEIGLPIAMAGAMQLSLGAKADRNVFSTGELLRSWRGRGSIGLTWALFLRDGIMLNVKAGFTYARKKSYLRGESVGIFLSQYIINTGIELEIPAGFGTFYSRSVYAGLESSEPSVPLSEQFYMGGAATLRGYRENQFHGRRTAYTRLEFRIGSTRFEHLYMFADGGYVLQPKPILDGGLKDESLLRSGFGFGIRTPTRVGNVDLSFGIGEKLSLRQTKVHVIMGYKF